MTNSMTGAVRASTAIWCLADRTEPVHIGYSASLRAVIVGERFPAWQNPRGGGCLRPGWRGSAQSPGAPVHLACTRWMSRKRQMAGRSARHWSCLVRRGAPPPQGASLSAVSGIHVRARRAEEGKHTSPPCCLCRKPTMRSSDVVTRRTRGRVYDAFRLSVEIDRNQGQIRLKALVSSAFTGATDLEALVAQGHSGGTPCSYGRHSGTGRMGGCVAVMEKFGLNRLDAELGLDIARAARGARKAFRAQSARSRAGGSRSLAGALQLSSSLASDLRARTVPLRARSSAL